MKLQQSIVFADANLKIGQIYEVMTEGRIAEEDVYIGRTYMDAPQVDGFLFFKAEEELLTGDMVKVKVIQAKGYDLIGEIVKGSEHE